MATVSIKVVPGSSRDRVAGRLGDAIKVTVSAPPEDGRANKAVCQLLAEFLNVKANQVQVIKGHAQRMKVIRIEGLEQTDLDARLAEV